MARIRKWSLMFVLQMTRIGTEGAFTEGKNHITLRDEEFVGPDKHLEEMIARRMEVPTALRAEIDEALNATVHLPEFTLFPNDTVAPQTSPPFRRHAPFRQRQSPPTGDCTQPRPPARRAWWWYYSAYDERFPEYNPENLKPRVLAFQEHIILITRQRMKDLEPLISKFSRDPRFLIAMMMHKLAEWLDLLRQMHASTLKLMTLRPNRIAIFYYVHSQRRHHDIEYTIDYMLHLHTNILKLVPAKPYNNRGVPNVNKDDVPDDVEDIAQEYLKALNAGKNPTLPTGLTEFQTKYQFG